MQPRLYRVLLNPTSALKQFKLQGRPCIRARIPYLLARAANRNLFYVGHLRRTFFPRTFSSALHIYVRVSTNSELAATALLGDVSFQ